MEKRINEPEDGEVALYVYEADMYRDLFELITEYMGECEHVGFDGMFVKPSEMKSFDHREKLGKFYLWRDFGEYAKISAGILAGEIEKEFGQRPKQVDE